MGLKTPTETKRTWKELPRCSNTNLAGKTLKQVEDWNQGFTLTNSKADETGATNVAGWSLWWLNFYNKLRQSKPGHTRISDAPIWRSKLLKFWLIKMQDNYPPSFTKCDILIPLYIFIYINNLTYIYISTCKNHISNQYASINRKLLQTNVFTLLNWRAVSYLILIGQNNFFLPKYWP